MIKDDFNPDEFFDFEKVKDHIVYRIINRQKNEALLKEVPHVDYLDLAIVFCYIFTGGEFDNATILIRNNHMDIWDVGVSQLMECADENTRKLQGLTVRSVFDYLKKIYGLKDIIPEDEADSLPLYVMSNNSGIFGAGCILYKGLLKSLSEKMESDFYVFPSSVHEVIILPDENRDAAEHFKDMVKEINYTELSLEDILSDSVYYYSRKDDDLVMLA